MGVRVLDESAAFAGRALDAAAGLAAAFLLPDRSPLGLGRTFLVFGFFIPLRVRRRFQFEPCREPRAFPSQIT